MLSVCFNPLVTAYAVPAPRPGSLSDSLSQTSGLPVPSKRAPLVRFTNSQISLPHRGRWILRSKSRRELACPERGGGFCEAKAGGVIKRPIALCLSQPLSQSALRRIASSPAGEPFGAPYKLRHKTNTGTASRPHSFTISSIHPPSGGFHMAQPYFTLRKQYFTARKRNFTARVSALTAPVPPSSVHP